MYHLVSAGALSLLYGFGSKKFSETSKTVEGPIWQKWLNGRSYEDSVYINGLPMSDARDEVSLTDGKTYKTQWFERARLEFHLEKQPPYDVLLGLLGTAAAKGRQNEAPFKPVANPAAHTSGIHLFSVTTSLSSSPPWFRETQHTLGDSSAGGQAIAAYWNNLDGLPQFGFPLSQPFMEKNKDDGKTYLVQYFERQRFEYHPENKGTRYEVLLGRLGAEQMNQKVAPNPPATPTPLPAARVYGPVNGQIAIKGNNRFGIGSVSSGVQARNFTSEVRFYNPQNYWSYGFDFRIGAGSKASIDVHPPEGDETQGRYDFGPTIKGNTSLQTGNVPNLNLAEGASNHLKLVVQDDKAVFFVNDSQIAAFDISQIKSTGDVQLYGYGLTGINIQFEGFTIQPGP